VAESGLTLGWPELKQAVGQYIGHGSTIGNWSVAQVATIEEIVQTGYRRVLYPPTMEGVPSAYEWSFLRPTTTLTMVVDTYQYDLPDDYGRIVGKFHYAADEHIPPVVVVSVADLLDMRSTRDYSSYPEFCAIRFKSATGAAGQRQEVLFYPTPDDTYVLSYSYDSYRNALSDTYPYPLGGMQMSELYKESCLAAAELRNGDELGIHTQMFNRLLVDAVARDSKRGAQNYGCMGQPPEFGDEEIFERGRILHEGAYSITYKGSQI